MKSANVTWFWTWQKCLGCSWAQDFIFLSDDINETELYLIEFPGCTSDPGIIDQMKASPEKIYLKALNKKAELSYSPFWKEREPPFIFVYFLA